MENLISIRTIRVRNFFLNLNVGSISRLENIKNCNIMELKYKIGEWVFHRFGDEIKHGKIVGYDDDCYIIKTLFIPRPYVNPKPHYVPSEWRFYVANKYGTRCFNVDSMTYLKYNIGDKLIFN
jgi:hypothetical protein